MGPSTFQDVQFMDSSTIVVNLEMSTNGQGPCLPHANSISYGLRGLKEEIVHKAPALGPVTAFLVQVPLIWPTADPSRELANLQV